MPSLSEIVRALRGSFLLASGDAGGYRQFDHSMEGFWRSFAAIFLIAPLALASGPAELMIAAEFGEVEREPDIGFHLWRLVMLGADWVAYPIAMVGLAKLLGVGQRYALYIIAYNWSSVMVAVVMIAPLLLFYLGIAGAGFAIVLNLAATLWALWFRFWVARTALEVNVPAAAGLAVFDFLLSMTILILAERLAS